MSPTHPLRVLGAALAVRPIPADLAAALVAPDLDWPRLLRAAGQHLVTPSLADALRRQGLFDALPAQVRDYLDGMRDLNRLRNRDLRAALEDIARALTPLDIQPVLLKGANALLPDQYPGAEDRVIGDLDLGVPPLRLAAAEGALLDLGYPQRAAAAITSPLLPREALHHQGHPLLHPTRLVRVELLRGLVFDDHEWEVRHHHSYPLLHPTRAARVELHRRLVFDVRDAARLQAGLTTTAQTLAAGSVVQVPDPGTRLLHNFLHAQINDRLRQRRGLNLRQLLEFAALAQRHPQILTPALLERLRRRRRRAFLEYLAQAEHWLGLAWPPGLPRTASARWELWLQGRALTSVGWRRLFTLREDGATLMLRLGPLRLRLLLTPDWLPWQWRWRVWREGK